MQINTRRCKEALFVKGVNHLKFFAHQQKDLNATSP